MIEIDGHHWWHHRWWWRNSWVFVKRSLDVERLTHKPKHKQRPKPRNKDSNPKIEIQIEKRKSLAKCLHDTDLRKEWWLLKMVVRALVKWKPIK